MRGALNGVRVLLVHGLQEVDEGSEVPGFTGADGYGSAARRGRGWLGVWRHFVFDTPSLRILNFNFFATSRVTCRGGLVS